MAGNFYPPNRTARLRMVFSSDSPGPSERWGGGSVGVKQKTVGALPKAFVLGLAVSSGLDHWNGSLTRSSNAGESRAVSMSAQASPPERRPNSSPTKPGAAIVARYWWLTALRGLVALALAAATLVAGLGTSRLVDFLALYWLAGGLITLRFAVAIRPRPGWGLGLAAGVAAVAGAVLVLLRNLLSGLMQPDTVVKLLGVAAVLTGLLRILGGFTAKERLGRRWTLGGIVLGTLEVALGAVLLLTTQFNAGSLASVVAAWGLASGILLLEEGIRLRHLRDRLKADTAR
jgi:uncharacterized membrane protein HdeD (DUF308 family)